MPKDFSTEQILTSASTADGRMANAKCEVKSTFAFFNNFVFNRDTG